MSELRRGPLPLLEECAECPLAVDGKPARPVKGIGPENPRFIVIAEGPGASEDREGVPLIGPSGKMLMRALNATGIKREDVWLGNSTLCVPRGGRDNEKEKERQVAEARRCCYNRLVKELDELGPDPPILAVGKHAANSFIGDKEFKITEMAGTFHVVDVPGLPFTKDVIPTVHPAAILRGKNDRAEGGAHTSDLLFWFLQYDVAKIAALSAGKLKPFSDDIEIFEADANAAVSALAAIYAEALAGDQILACDTETTGVECSTCPHCPGYHSALEATRAELTAIGFATEQHAISINWHILGTVGQALLRNMFADDRITWVFHNGGYDTVVLESRGFPIVGPREDTLYLHHNAFPGLPHKLQRVGSQFYLLRPWKAEFNKDGTTVKDLLTYNARDTLVTRRLRNPLRAVVKRREAMRTYDLDIRKVEMAKWMQIRGIPLSLERNEVLRSYFAPRVEKARTALLARMEEGAFKEEFKQLLVIEQAKTVRKKDDVEFEMRRTKREAELEKKWTKLEKKGEDLFNLNSQPQLVAYLKACGVRLTQYTKKGKLSTKKAVLESLLVHEPVQELLMFRANEKQLTTFIDGFRQRVDQYGRVHATWSPNKITGRFGSSPNAQNFSKGTSKHRSFDAWQAALLAGEDPGVPNLRWQVVAPAGRWFVGADYKQLEARIVALLSGDEWLCNMFSTDQDIHTYFASMIFPNFKDLDPKDHVRAFLRDVTKRAEYGYFYGAAETTVWKSLLQVGIKDVPLAMIGKMFQVFRQKMPKVTQFYDKLLRKVVEDGKVSTFFLGRTIHFPLGNVDPSAIKSFVCQAAGAEIADTGILRVHDSLNKNDYVLIHGHDSVTVECDKGRVDEVGALVKSCMEQTHTYNGVTMRFGVDLKNGQDWGSV